MNENEKSELLKLKNEIETISKEHDKNERMRTLKNECLGLLKDIENGNDTRKYQLKITKHNGKMDGIRSLSTYKLTCKTCLSLKDNKATICSKCYVDNAFKRYPQLSLAMIYNTLLLKFTKLSKRQLPIINDLYFRFESFSDLQNEQHLQNLYAIARHNPYTQFALWSKNYALVWKEKAPKNVNIILSNYYLNKDLQNADMLIRITQNKTGCKNVKVFSVYDDEHIQNQNCEKHCITCLKCYKKNDKTKLINELLK